MTREEAIGRISETLNIPLTVSELIVEKAKIGGEINEETTYDQWLSQRFIPNTVEISLSGYAEMCIDALKIVQTTAATDYGGSRQRDLGQLWADMTRGYLGEYAFKLFLEDHNVEVELGHEQGSLKDYLPLDIHSVKKNNEKARAPRIDIGVKATKWNGIWMDIPGKQFFHSDIHVFVKIGGGRDHLFAFFNELGFFEKLLFKFGTGQGFMTNEDEEELLSHLPHFEPIHAYIAGFVDAREETAEASYTGRLAKKHYTISGWQGLFKPEDLHQIKQTNNVPGEVKFEGIQSFSGTGQRYLFNAGNLEWKPEDWKKIVSEL